MNDTGRANSMKIKERKITSETELLAYLNAGDSVSDEAVTEISLAEASVPETFGSQVMRALVLPSVISSLAVLDISYNCLSDGFWSAGDAILTTATTKPTWTHLKKINMSNNQFSEQSFDVLQRILRGCPGLLHFDFSMNSLGYCDKYPAYPTDNRPAITSFFTALDTNISSSSLQVLDLSCLHITDGVISGLVGSRFAGALQRLYLRSNDITDKGAAVLAQALPTMKLQILALSGNAIGRRGAGALAFAIDQTATLQSLDLEENEIDMDGLEIWYHVLNGLTKPFPLRYLHLARNCKHGRSSLLLAQIQRKVQEKILETHILACSTRDASNQEPVTRLNLSGRVLKKSLAMNTSMTDHLVPIALTAIRWCDEWKTLEQLDLGDNSIDTRGASEIGMFLSLLPSLQALNLSHNRINDEGIIGLADGIEFNPTLRELNLNHNSITDRGARQLYLKAFTSNLQRKILLSEGNPLTSECKVMVAAISQAHDLRKRFATEFAHLDKLDFAGRQLRQYGAAAVVELLLSTPTKCTILDISRNYLGDEGAVEIAKLLRCGTQLTRLDLSFNDIGDNGAAALADALKVNSTLTALSLHSSISGSVAKPRLTENGLSALARALETHKALVHLDLRDNVMSSAVIAVLVTVLQRNPGIQKFNGSSAEVFLARNTS